MLNKTFDIVATTLAGLEPLLRRELLHEGMYIEETGVRSIKVIGNLSALYRLNLKSRLALRFLVPVLQFHAAHPDEFYKKIRRFDWGDILSPGDTYAIDSVVNSPVFRNSLFMLYRCKDAINDHFVNNGQERPNIDTENPTVRINLHIQGKKVNISLDSSGESLHKRGYRMRSHPAPLNEVLAAALIDLSGWDEKSVLLDGMTGSGTLAIEAALKASRRAPGLLKSDFGFMKWKNFDQTIYEQERTKLKEQIIMPPAKIIGIDRDLSFVAMAKEHANKAGVLDFTEFKTGNFLTFNPPADAGHLLLNPPYGDRLDDGNINELYSDIGSRLKHAYSGWQAWIISGNFEALKKIGLKPMKKHAVKNGQIDCSYRGFELFSGKRIEKLKDQ